MINLLTKKEARELLGSNEHSPSGEYKPIGKFLVFNGHGSWDAIDNSSGDAWTENFDSPDKALAWLADDRTKEDMEKDEEPTALANSGAGDRDYSADDGMTGNLSYDFETAFDQDRLLHLHASDVELTELITSYYERETGKSCVTWLRPGYAPEHESLPRPDDYETRGYTENFWKWMKSIETKAIEAGVEDVDEMAAFFMGYLWPEAAELRGERILKQVEQLEPQEEEGPRKIRLYELLPLVKDMVRVEAPSESGTWSARYSCGAEALKKMRGSPDLLDSVVDTVLAYTPMCSLTNGTICASEPSHVVILLAPAE